MEHHKSDEKIVNICRDIWREDEETFQPSVVELINLWQTLYNVIAIAISVADMLLFLLYQFLYV